jgi:hypothetical protein
LEIRFTKHAIEKVNARYIFESDVQVTLNEPDNKFYDEEHQTFVALKFVRNRYLVILYTHKDETFRVVTLYSSTKIDKLIKSKIRRGAWVKIQGE